MSLKPLRRTCFIRIYEGHETGRRAAASYAHNGSIEFLAIHGRARRHLDDAILGRDATGVRRHMPELFDQFAAIDFIDDSKDAAFELDAAAVGIARCFADGLG